MRPLSLLLALAIFFAALPAGLGQTADTLTISELETRYPNAEFREVSFDEFNSVTTNKAGNEVIVVIEPSTQTAPRPAVVKDDPGPERLSRRSRMRHERPSSATCTGGDVYCAEAFGSFDVSSRETAVVVFVLVGVVVVAAAIIYTGVFIYDAVTGVGDQSGWVDSGGTAWFFHGGERSGGMYGGWIAGGFLGEFADVGLKLEGGYMHCDVAVREDSELVSVSAGYAMIGPMVRWILDDRLNPTAVELELLTGMSGDSDVGMISRASAGISWGLGNTWRMGINIGSLYMKIRKTEGPIRTDSDFNLALGLSIGRQF